MNLQEILKEAEHAHLAGDLARAEKLYWDAIEVSPETAEIHFNLGAVLNSVDRKELAVECYREAIRLRPNYPKALNNLGRLLIELKQFEEAIRVLEQAVQLNPSYASAHCNLGGALRELGRLDEAVAACKKAEALQPESCLASLGSALLEQDKFDEAAVAIGELIRLRPDSAEAHKKMVPIYMRQGKIAEAMKWIDRYLELVPDDAENRFDRAMLWLQQGDFERGWPEYEWRWKCKEFIPHAPRRQAWDGSPTKGAILLHAEQGYGDTLQFIRYTPLVKRQVGAVILSCPKRLTPILSRCRDIDQIVSGSPLPEFQTEITLPSLPGVFKTTLASIPRKVPYLFADPELIDHWRVKLPSKGFRIGIAWQGSREFKNDYSRSVPLEQFAPLAAVKGVQLISLQKEHGREQIAAVRDRMEVMELPAGFDEESGAFMDTAAIMMNLDLVISTDTAIAHIAGGLGVPIWLATSFMPDWRWMLERTDSPWYPTMRLFRQPKLGDWKSVFEEMARELKKLTA